MTAKIFLRERQVLFWIDAAFFISVICVAFSMAGSHDFDICRSRESSYLMISILVRERVFHLTVQCFERPCQLPFPILININDNGRGFSADADPNLSLNN